jgi:hypothetical protein
MSKMKDLYYLYQTDPTARQFYDLGVCDALHSLLLFYQNNNLEVPYGVRDALLNLVENSPINDK